MINVDLLAGSNTIEFRHVEIHENDIKGSLRLYSTLSNGLDCLGPVFDMHDRVPHILQYARRQKGVHGIVLCQKHTRRAGLGLALSYGMIGYGCMLVRSFRAC